VDQIDLMQIHFGPDPQKVLDDGETVAAMKAAQKEGKIRFLGASTWGDIAKQCIDSGDFQVMQLDYSLLTLGDEHLVNLCGEKGIGVFLRGGLAYGRLTSRVIPHLNELGHDKEKITQLLKLVNNDGEMLTSLALNFLYNNPNVSTVLVGSKNIEHIRKNFELLERGIDPEIMKKAMDICK
jgi:aryl-alcohol dehydrogenase-like predicted oxidoreductase